MRRTQKYLTFTIAVDKLRPCQQIPMDHCKLFTCPAASPTSRNIRVIRSSSSSQALLEAFTRVRQYRGTHAN